MNGAERWAVTSFERRRCALGWTCSVLLHAFIVAVSLGVMTSLRPAPDKEPFRWEVSLVETVKQEDVPAEPMRMREAAPPSQSPRPHTQPAPVEPVRPSPQPIVRHVETIERQIRQVVTRVQPVTPVMEVEPQSIPSQPVQPTEMALRERAPVQHVAERHTVRAREPIQQGTNIQTLEALSQPIRRTEAATTEAQSVVQKSSIVAAMPSVIQQPEPTSTTTIATAPTQSAEVVERLPVVEQSAVTPVTRHPVPIPDPAPVQAKAGPPARSAVADHREPEVPVPSAQEAASQVALTPRSAPAAKADYSWLAESLWRRVAELKRYPLEARLNGWEGKVVLTAVIREDGHLGDLRIQKSSGYEILDQDAMELVRRVCPLHLKHPLGRPEVVVQIPISYALR